MSTATKPSYEEVVETARQLREGLCAAMRVIAEIDTWTLLDQAIPGIRSETAQQRFVDEVHAIGLKDGFGKRCDDVLKRATES
jgi:hypothetical protein